MTAGFERYYWQQRELERALIGFRSIDDTWSSISKAFQSEIARPDMLRVQFTLPPDFLATTALIRQQLDALPKFDSLGLLSSLHSATFEAIRQDQKFIEELARSMTQASIPDPVAMRPMLDSLVSVEAIMGLGSIGKEWIDIALQPHRAFHDFAKLQLDLAANESILARQHRIALLNPSMQMLESITRGLDLAAIMRPASEEIWIGPTPDINVFRALATEVAAYDYEQQDVDAGSAVDNSCSNQIVQLGASIVQLVFNLNVESEREGGHPVFKPTTKTMMAFAIIPSRVAQDADSFAAVVDQLYFLLYEGSGDAKRLTALKDRSALEGLWRLKQLRLGFRHDHDHGDASATKVKHLKVGEAYQAYTGQVIPRTDADWMAAQLALYEDLLGMLQGIWLR